MVRQGTTHIPATNVDAFIQRIPEINELARISWFNLYNMDSCLLSIEHWNAISRKIFTIYDRFSGFVVMHGTDTMVYTSTALSFIFRGLNKPIIFTGSQKPLSERRNDARINIINSIEIATHPVAEVAICFGKHLLRANRCSKNSTFDFDAFHSANFPPLAHIGRDITWHGCVRKAEKPAPKVRLFPLKAFDVPIVKLHPGFNARHLYDRLESRADGFILETFGSGTLPDYAGAIRRFIATATERDIPVLLTSQCTHGRIEAHLYETGAQALASGAISANDMTTEAAYIKLLSLLSHHYHLDKIKISFKQNMAGETS